MEMKSSILSRVVAVALLTAPLGYLLEVDKQDWGIFRRYSHSELLIFLVGCGFIACVELLAWLLQLPFAERTSVV